jgi:hypothetical protein
VPARLDDELDLAAGRGAQMVAHGLRDGDLALGREEITRGQYTPSVWRLAPKRDDAGYSPTCTITTAFEIPPAVRVAFAAVLEAVHFVADHLGRTVSTPQETKRARSKMRVGRGTNRSRGTMFRTNPTRAGREETARRRGRVYGAGTRRYFWLCRAGVTA